MTGPTEHEQVWIATARRGTTAHRLATQAKTRCGRSTRTGLTTTTATTARERHQAVWCPRCWPAEEDQ